MTEKIGWRRGWIAAPAELLTLGPVVAEAGGAAVAARTGRPAGRGPFGQSLGEFVFGVARGGDGREGRS